MQMYRKDFGIPNIKQYLTVCSIKKKKTFKDLELSNVFHIFAVSKKTFFHNSFIILGIFFEERNIY